VDLEATGPESPNYSICELAAILLEKNTLKEISRFHTDKFIRPIQFKFHEAAMNAHKIEINDILEAPRFEDEIIRFENWLFENGIKNLTDVMFGMWGIDFDISFLRSHYHAVNRDWPYVYRHYDVRTTAFKYCKDRNIEFDGLYDCARKLGMQVDKSKMHRALHDVIVTTEVLKKVW